MNTSLAVMPALLLSRSGTRYNRVPHQRGQDDRQSQQLEMSTERQGGENDHRDRPQDPLCGFVLHGFLPLLHAFLYTNRMNLWLHIVTCGPSLRDSGSSFALPRTPLRCVLGHPDSSPTALVPY